jgi:hypothetical protein
MIRATSFFRDALLPPRTWLSNLIWMDLANVGIGTCFKYTMVPVACVGQTIVGQSPDWQIQFQRLVAARPKSKTQVKANANRVFCIDKNARAADQARLGESAINSLPKPYPCILPKRVTGICRGNRCIIDVQPIRMRGTKRHR